jgi:Mg2+ and Co2+ transporter CorA
MRDAMIVLLRRDLGLFSREAQRYLQDIYDHLVRVVEASRTTRTWPPARWRRT